MIREINYLWIYKPCIWTLASELFWPVLNLARFLADLHLVGKAAYIVVVYQPRGHIGSSRSLSILKENLHQCCWCIDTLYINQNYFCHSSEIQFVNRRGPNLFFKYFYFLFGPGLFYPLRVIATVQNFFGTLVGPLTLWHPKMKNLSRHNQAPWCSQPPKKSLTLEGLPK